MTDRRLDDLARSERYFTATLLPALLLRDPEVDVRAFVTWLEGGLGLQAHAVDGSDRAAPLRVEGPMAHLEVVTELNLKRDLGHYAPGQLEAAAADPAVEEARALGTDRQSVPDVVIRADDLLVVIEGKFFVSGVTPASLGVQLVEQREEIALMVAHLGGDIRRVAHLYLGPEHLGELPCDGSFTWTDVADWSASRVGEAHYVTRRLREAVARYDAARGSRERGPVIKNYADRLSLPELIAACETQGDALLVGFHGGLAALREAEPEALRTRPFKVDVADGGLGRKLRKNWLHGSEVLEVLRRKGLR